MKRPIRRVDRNQSELVAQLIQVGATVQTIHTVGQGVPDLLVGYRGRNYLLEVKDGRLPPSRRKLTNEEEFWHFKWRGQVGVVKNINEALQTIGAMEKLT